MSRFVSKYEDKFDWSGDHDHNHHVKAKTNPLINPITHTYQDITTSHATPQKYARHREASINWDRAHNYEGHIHAKQPHLNIGFSDAIAADNPVNVATQVAKDKLKLAEIERQKSITGSKKEGWLATTRLGFKAANWQKEHPKQPLPVCFNSEHDIGIPIEYNQYNYPGNISFVKKPQQQQQHQHDSKLDKQLQQAQHKATELYNKSKEAVIGGTHSIMHKVDKTFNTDLDKKLNYYMHTENASPVIRTLWSEILGLSQIDPKDLKSMAKDSFHNVTEKIDELKWNKDLGITEHDFNEIKSHLYHKVNNTVDFLNEEYDVALGHTWDFIKEHDTELMTAAGALAASVLGKKIWDNVHDTSNDSIMSQLLQLSQDKLNSLQPKDVYNTLPDTIKKNITTESFEGLWSLAKQFKPTKSDNVVEKVKHGGEDVMKQFEKIAKDHDIDWDSIKDRFDDVTDGVKRVTGKKKSTDVVKQFEKLAKEHNIDWDSIKDRFEDITDDVKKGKGDNIMKKFEKLAKEYDMDWDSIKDRFDDITGNDSIMHKFEKLAKENNIDWDSIKDRFEDVTDDMKKGSKKSDNMMQQFEKLAKEHNIDWNSIKDHIGDVAKDVKKGKTGDVVDKFEKLAKEYDLDWDSIKDHIIDLTGNKTAIATTTAAAGMIAKAISSYTSDNDDNNDKKSDIDSPFNALIKKIPKEMYDMKEVKDFLKSHNINIPTDTDDDTLLEKLPLKTLAVVAASTGALAWYCHEHDINIPQVVREMYQEAMVNIDPNYQVSTGSLSDVYHNAIELASAGLQRTRLNSQYNKTMESFKSTIDTLKHEYADETTIAQFDQLGDQYEQLMKDWEKFKSHGLSREDIVAMVTNSTNSTATTKNNDGHNYLEELRNIYLQTKSLFDGSSVLLQDIATNATPHMKEKITDFIASNQTTIDTMQKLAGPVIHSIASTGNVSDAVTGGLVSAVAGMVANTLATNEKDKNENRKKNVQNDKDNANNNNDNKKNENVNKEARHNKILASVIDFNNKINSLSNINPDNTYTFGFDSENEYAHFDYASYTDDDDYNFEYNQCTFERYAAQTDSEHENYDLDFDHDDIDQSDYEY